MTDSGFRALAEAPSPADLAKYDLNDFGNAMRLIRLTGGQVSADFDVDTSQSRLLYLRNRGWIAFNERKGCWDLDHGEALAMREAMAVSRGLYAQMELKVEEYEEWCELQEPPQKPNAKRVQAYRDFGNSAGNSGRINAMLTVAEPFLQVDLDAFDRDPLLLNVANGTLRFWPRPGPDLKASVEFRAGHDPADRCTRICAAKYDPEATAPLFTGHVGFVLPSAEISDAVQRIMGYAATGHTKEQAFFVFQGKGGDGKSTLVNACREVLGTYADTCGVETFLDTGLKRGGDASPDVARLAGATRLISTGEPPRNSKLNTGAIKAYTGGAPVLARELRQGIFSFTPIGKVVLECNNRPSVPDSDDGIWRRLVIVPFEVQIEKSGRAVDMDLPEKLRAEGPGILNWIVAGVLKWLDDGLTRPQAVKDALEDYRRGANPFAQWLKERVILDKDAVELAGDLYKDYKKWMVDNDHEKPMSQKSFGAALGDLQIILAGKDGAGLTRRRGAKLRSPYEPPEGEDPGPVDPAGAGGQSGGGEAAPPPEDPGDYEREEPGCDG